MLYSYTIPCYTKLNSREHLGVVACAFPGRFESGQIGAGGAHTISMWCRWPDSMATRDATGSVCEVQLAGMYPEVKNHVRCPCRLV